jgi:hypothetical protein
LKLEIVSTDEVLSMKNGEADISICYVRSTPTDGPSFELTRDRGGAQTMRKRQLGGSGKQPPESITSTFRIFPALSA